MGIQCPTTGSATTYTFTTSSEDEALTSRLEPCIGQLCCWSEGTRT